MSHNRYVHRREFLQLMGITAVATTLPASIARALAIPAHNATGTIQDVENVVILMQENRPFDHHFGTLRGVRGFADPRAVNINLPLQSGGSVLAPVFLQPAGAANVAAGFSVPPDYGTLGGPADGVPVIPPFRVNPESISPGLTSLGFTYFPGVKYHPKFPPSYHLKLPPRLNPVRLGKCERRIPVSPLRIEPRSFIRSMAFRVWA